MMSASQSSKSFPVLLRGCALLSFLLHLGVLVMVHLPVRHTERGAASVALHATLLQQAQKARETARPIRVPSRAETPLRAPKRVAASAPKGESPSVALEFSPSENAQIATPADATMVQETTPVPTIRPETLRNAARQLARDIAQADRLRNESKTVVLEAPSAFQREVEKGAPARCSKAYAQFGLLAVPLLLRDAVSDSGCRWR